MTRKELVKIGANNVRKNATLFAAFKKFIFEDAKKVFPNGKVPSGCFNCGFQSNFSRWAKTVDMNEEPKQLKGVKKMSEETKTYELKNRNTRLYFNGKVLSALSSDSEWVEWIKRPRDKELVEKRKDYFKKLPSELAPKPKKVEEVKGEEQEDKKEEVKVVEAPKRGRKKKS